MKKPIEEEIKELEMYLSDRLSNVYFPNSGGSISGYANKFKIYSDEISNVNTEVSAFANNILKNSEHPELTQIFGDMIKQYVSDLTTKFKQG
jgi:hypothetical protein